IRGRAGGGSWSRPDRDQTTRIERRPEGLPARARADSRSPAGASAAAQKRGAPRVAFLEGFDVGADLWDSFSQEFFFGGGIGAQGGLAAGAAMLRQAILAARGLDHTRMRRHESRPSVDFNLVFGLAHFDVASDEVVGDGIAIGLDRDVSFHIHQTL